MDPFVFVCVCIDHCKNLMRMCWHIFDAWKLCIYYAVHLMCCNIMCIQNMLMSEIIKLPIFKLCERVHRVNRNRLGCGYFVCSC